MKNQKLIFILVGAFCVLALIAGIYAQFFVGSSNNNNIQNPDNNINNEIKPKTQEEIKSQLNSLFTNEIISNDYDETNLQKRDASKGIVYSAYDIQKQEGNYELDVHLPVINIKDSVATDFNKMTQSIFANKASDILNNKYTEKVIYSVDYISYVNDNILSLVIKSTLKQGNNPQRVIIQAYNYNLETGEKVQLVDVLAKRNIIQSDCQNKIHEIVTKAQEEAQVLVQSGYTVYNRNLSDSMYQISNISTFFLGKNEELYIIFAYGNQNFTSEMDVVLYE
ncbi:MAG: hypothetical protein UGE22_02165 [Clostridia bacterium]|jgi:hypothetical protein|nr:hypothetical protein [Clostridia bacterium]